MKKYEYILRFTIDPGHFEKDRFLRLIDFCEAAKIDDIMFFVDCEELNQGHITKDRLKIWLNMISQFSDELAMRGITLSLNPWTTLLHADRGRKLAPNQDFGLMCDYNGRTSAAQACPISKKWREYISEIYATYATIKPRMIWVEDDFRFHNHAPLTWGGCFCDEHMEMYSKIAGKVLTRKEFLDGILKKGKPHKYRKIWLDFCRKTTIENAQIIEKAVHRVSPNTIIGLMSSMPEKHCAEFRDWTKLMEAFSGENASAVLRPHLPMYLEESPQDYQWKFNSISTLTRAFVGDDYIFYPELDNGTFPSFSVSDSLTKLKLYSSALLNSKGITLNIFDMMGNGILDGERYTKILSESKPLLEKISSFDLMMKKEIGIKVLVDQESSFYIETTQSNDLTDLYPTLGFFKSLLSSFGIATSYTTNKEISGEIVAISGQMLNCLSNFQIKQLFEKNYLIIDAECVEILINRKLLHLIGVEKATWQKYDNGLHTYEQICNGLLVDGIEEARITSQAYCGDYLDIIYSKEQLKVDITTQRNAPGMIVGTGQTVINNKVFIFPYGHMPRNTRLHQYLPQREIFHYILKDFDVPYILNSENVVVQAYRKEDKFYLILLNFSNDPCLEIKMKLPKSKSFSEYTCISIDNVEGSSSKLLKEDNVYEFVGFKLMPNEIVALIIS